MGLLSNMFGTSKPSFDPDAAQARVEALASVLPAGATVSVIEPSKGIELTYVVDVVGDRRQTTAMLTSVVEIVSAGEERWSVTFTVYDIDDPSSTYSAIELADAALRKLEVVLRAHDDLHAVIPSQSILLDVMDGGFHISDVPRGQAVSTAGAAVRWWEDTLQHDESWQWSDSVLSVDIGGDEEGNAEIVYRATIEREIDPMGHGRTAQGTKYVSDAEWAQRVFSAWTDNLPLLEALLRLSVPPGHEAELTFDKNDQLRAHLRVAAHETFDEDKDAAKELVATIRSHVPDTTLKVY
jgi:hypothetical protein